MMFAGASVDAADCFSKISNCCATTVNFCSRIAEPFLEKSEGERRSLLCGGRTAPAVIAVAVKLGQEYSPEIAAAFALGVVCPCPGRNTTLILAPLEVGAICASRCCAYSAIACKSFKSKVCPSNRAVAPRIPHTQESML